ncbi:MAG: FxsA family protein, partial [Betaproteobacteria bacterium]|nr:FxsA family protein [Betaproteobacteria bacterium]
AGIVLLRNERLAFRARTLAALHGDEPLLRGVVDSGRKVLAGFLLLLPGVVSDLLAVALLMLPLNVGPAFGTASGNRAIEGRFRRIE